MLFRSSYGVSEVFTFLRKNYGTSYSLFVNIDWKMH